jgi:hypothetical protein
MQFLIADSFTDSLARLTGEEQKAAKTTAFDLQVNWASPGLRFHKLGKGKDKNFWSVRVSADIRIIVHRTEDSLLLCYVDHHDKAYAWAERRKLETHPKTGAAQLVEVRERVEEIIIPVYVEAERPPLQKPLLFDDRSDDELLGYGVPAEWLKDVRQADEDSLFAVAEHLPAEAAEALLELATGGQPKLPKVPEPVAPFEHPDAQRRFRVMSSVEELERALSSPWDKWTIFLHPEQRELVEREYSGPARISGSAGTGKTIVALHRAAYLAQTNPDARVLLTTFSEPMAHALRVKLRRLIGNDPRLGERIDVDALDSVGLRLYKAQCGPVKLAARADVRELIRAASQSVEGHNFSLRFLVTEWEQIVDAWQLSSWQAYHDVPRLGRQTRLPQTQRKKLWSIYERVIAELQAQELTTQAGVFTKLAAILPAARPYDFAVVDEAQDLNVAQMRFLAALGGGRPDALFFAADLGQRIFQQPFSWKALGVDVTDRTFTLRVNYRTSHQIRTQADRLLPATITDVDGHVEDRGDTVSAFNGPLPAIETFKLEAEEVTRVAEWLKNRASEGVRPHEVAIFVRSAKQVPRARAALQEGGIPFKVLDEHVETVTGSASICTLHLAKGLEFKAVVVMACDDEVIPFQERIEAVGDDADLQEVYDTERHLLYVACTRAREHLLVTGVEPASEFLDDLQESL